MGRAPLAARLGAALVRGAAVPSCRRSGHRPRASATDNRRRARVGFMTRSGSGIGRSHDPLPAKAQLRDECSIPLDVVAPEVVEQPTAPTDEHQQPAARVMVLLVDLQVLRQVVDALVRSAIWTSGEPVSVSWRRCSAIVAVVSGMRGERFFRLRKRSGYHGAPDAGAPGRRPGQAADQAAGRPRRLVPSAPPGPRRCRSAPRPGAARRSGRRAGWS